MADHDEVPLPEHPVLRRHIERTRREADEGARAMRTIPERLAALRAERSVQGGRKRRRGVERD